MSDVRGTDDPMNNAGPCMVQALPPALARVAAIKMKPFTPTHSPTDNTPPIFSHAVQAGQAAALAARSIGGSRAHIAKSAGAAAGSAIIAAGGSACEAGNAAASATLQAGGTKQHIVSAAGAAGKFLAAPIAVLT